VAAENARNRIQGHRRRSGRILSEISVYNDNGTHPAAGQRQGSRSSIPQTTSRGRFRHDSQTVFRRQGHYLSAADNARRISARTGRHDTQNARRRDAGYSAHGARTSHNKETEAGKSRRESRYAENKEHNREKKIRQVPGKMPGDDEGGGPR